MDLISLLIPTAWSTIIHARHDKLTRSITAESRPDDSDEESTNSSDTDNMKQEFVNSIDIEAVRAIASRNNHGKSCTVTEPLFGSFNVCFVIKFDSEDTTWVISIPSVPAVHDAWDKLRSEVVIMEYIREKTTIRIPKIYKYGRNKTLTTTGSEIPFLILDYVPGRLLSMHALKYGEEIWRKRFFVELIGVFAQL
ncbi:hypothetical protein PT974_02905 [Cladobotryum mycophilum]|uniref:Aminoglycoside phosphotransferase domain-containing protein n=1 Tax=Cladobotryum mycophilum TaxID=491253 RepID=A0ABR0SZF8_9HYPO